MLTALGLPHELVRSGAGWSLLVPGELAERCAGELLRWEAENAAPREEPPLRRRSSGRDGAALWALVLATAWLAQRNGAFGLDWEAAGRLEGSRVRSGDWWRATTALLLHADPAHLWSNVAFGALMVGALCWLLGSGAGVLLTLLAGSLGNLGAAWLRPGGAALGASTAAFAALGAIAALAWRRRAALLSGRLRRWAPLIAALALLGYLGAEGERVDVLGHACGFAAGLGLGAGLGGAGALLPGRRVARALDRLGVQWSLGALAAAWVGLAWWLALAG